MANENEYMLFLDESGVTPENSYLVLGGVLISRNNYSNNLIPNIRNCKSIIGDPYIILHTTDITKKLNGFECLSNMDLSNKFWSELFRGLNNTEYNILSAYTKMHDYRNKYPTSLCVEEYALLFSTIINSFVYFLCKNNARGSIVFEARDDAQNRRIQKHYFHLLSHGTNIYKPIAIEKYIATVSFVNKEDNCIGLQVADIIANTIMRHINNMQIRGGIWKAIESKFYDGGSKNIDDYGMIKLF